MKLMTKHHFSRKLLILFLFFVVLDGCKKADRFSEELGSQTSSLSRAPNSIKPSAENADVVYQWYRFMAGLQRSVSPQPAVFVQARAYGYIGIGLFESVQPGIKGGSSFSPKLNEMPAMPTPDNSEEYLWSASANAALASLFKQFLPSLSTSDRASVDAKELEISNQLKLTTPDDVIERSEAFGRSIAAAIHNWSTSDNFSITSGGYTPLNEPWAYVSTPPNFPTAVGDNLRYSRPFLKYSLDATAPPMAVPFSTDHSSGFYAEALEVHDIGGSTTASTANKATANWWADAGGVGTGLPAPYHMLSIITNMLESQHAGLAKAAEVYAKTGIALKDGNIITFRAKYQYNLVRPITYIRQNIDPTWLSHLTTPPYPEYSSGLVGLFGPVLQVLINEFGDIPVTDNAYDWRSLPARHFNSISDLRLEAALSRIYAGIHYRFTQMTSIDMAVELGNQIDKVRVVGPEYK